MAGGTLASLLIRLGVDASGVKTGMAQAEGFFGNFGKKATIAGGIAGAAMADFAMTGMRANVELDDQMRQIWSIIPEESAAGIDKMRGQVRGLAVEFGSSTGDIAQGMYDALSSGVTQDKLTSFMETATKTAKAGVADTADTVKVLAAVQNAYRMDSEETAEAADQMFKAVQLGVTTIPELSAELSGVTPQASAMGVAFDEVLASITAMTLQGTPTGEAITNMNASLTMLQKPLPALRKGLEEAGFATGQAAIDALGYQGAMELVRDISEKTGKTLPQLTGRIQGTSAVLQLTGENADAAHKAIAGVQDSTGAVDQAFEIMEGGVGGAVRRAQAMVQDFALTIGGALEPVAPIFMAFGPQIGHWISRGFGAVVGAIAGSIVGPLANAVGKGLSTAFNAIASGPAGSALQSAMTKLGGLMGGWLGPVMAIAVAGYLAMELGKVIDDIRKQQEAIEKQRVEVVPTMNLEEVDAAIAEMEKVKREKIHGGVIEGFLFGQLNLGGVNEEVEKSLTSLYAQRDAIIANNKVDAETALFGQTADMSIADKMAGGLMANLQSAIDGAMAEVEVGGGMDFVVDTAGAGDAVGDLRQTILNGLDATVNAAQEGMNRVSAALSKPPKIISYEKRLAQQKKAISALYKGMHKAIKADDPVNAAYYQSELMRAIQSFDQFKGNHAKSMGAVKKELKAAGLMNDQIMKIIRGKTKKTGSDVEKHGKKIGAGPRKGIQAEKGPTIAAEQSTMNGIASTAESTATQAGTWGAHLAQNYAAGISSNSDLAGAAAEEMAAKVKQKLGFSAPPRTGPLSSIREWGPHMVDTWAQGVERNLRRARRAADRFAEAGTPVWRRPEGAYGAPGGFAAVNVDHQLTRRDRDSRGDCIHVGTLIATESGLDKLDRKLERRRKHRTRGARRRVTDKN